MGTRIAIAKTPAGYTVKPIDFLGGDLFQAYRNATAGARWDPLKRLNIVKDVVVLNGILKRLASGGFVPVLDEATKEATKTAIDAVSKSVARAEVRMDQIDAALSARGLSLYPFQRSGVQWLSSRSSALLADEMGLGKTIQALAALPEGIGVIVVCPVVLKENWKREISQWRPDLTVTIISGRGNFRWPAPGEVVIINYDVLPQAAMIGGLGSKYKDPKFVQTIGSIQKEDPSLAQSKPKDYPVRLILDEAHYVKSSKAARTVACRALDALCDGVLTMTATPLVNRPMELYSVLQFGGLAREAFGSFEVFKQLFGGREEQVSSTQKALVWKGVTDEIEVGKRLRRVMIRRLRSEVLPELPTKTYRTISVALSSKHARLADKVVKQLLEQGIDYIKVSEISDLPFEVLSAVRAAIAQAKIPTLEALIESYEEQGEPVVVFSAHHAPLDHIGRREGWGIIHGATPQDDRAKLVEEFQAGRLKGLACGIKAAGVGITLTRSAHAVFVDRAWTPADNLQAEDRICRIGQTRGCVITTLVSDHALDKHLTALIEQKMKLISASVEQGRQISKQIDLIDIDALIEESEKRATQQALEEEEARVLSEGGKKRGALLLRPCRYPIELWARRGIEQLFQGAGDLGPVVNIKGGERVLRALQEDEGLLSEQDWKDAVKFARDNYNRMPTFGA